MLLDLDDELLLDIWPSSRVVAGRRICHRFREMLSAARTTQLRTGRLWEPPITSRSTIATDLYRLQHSHVQLHASACRLPVESVVEGALLACRQGFTALTSLDLSYAEVGADLSDELVEVLSRSKGLRELDLSGNHLGPTGSLKMCKELETSTTLVQLSAGRMNLSSAAMQLASTVCRLVQLEHLDVSGNRLQDYGAQLLADALVNCTELQQIDVSYNDIQEAGGLALAVPLRQCAKLRHFACCRNTLGAVAAEAVFEPRFLRLAHLDLRFNQIEDSGVSQLVAALAEGGSLEDLDLAYNRIGSVGAESLGMGLLPLSPRLRKLKLKFNCVGDEGATALAAGAAQCPGLQVLVLCYNSIGDRGASALAHQLVGGSLEHLHLRSNRIGMAGAQALAELAGQCGWLQCVDLYGNGVEHLRKLGMCSDVLRFDQKDCRATIAPA